MSQPYFLPLSLTGFSVWSANFSAEITGTPTIYGLVAGDATAYATLNSTFQAALMDSTTPATRSPVSVAATQTAFAAARAKAQDLVQKSQASGLLTPTLAAQIAVTFRDTTKTPIAAPTAIPVLAVEEVTPLATKMRIKELGSLSNALPAGCVGYEVGISVAPVTPPLDPSALTLVGSGTRRFYTHSFDGGDVGKAAYFAIRYVTARQLKGPWSNIITTTVVGG